jgi:hypothetical protein
MFSRGHSYKEKVGRGGIFLFKRNVISVRDDARRKRR